MLLAFFFSFVVHISFSLQSKSSVQISLALINEHCILSASKVLFSPALFFQCYSSCYFFFFFVNIWLQKPVNFIWNLYSSLCFWCAVNLKSVFIIELCYFYCNNRLYWFNNLHWILTIETITKSLLKSFKICFFFYFFYFYQ